MSDDGKALEIIQKSGILNPKMTLGEIMEVSSRLDTLDIDTVAGWTFVGPNWVYKGANRSLEEDTFRK